MGLTKGPYCVDQLSHQALEQSSYPMATIACKPLLSKVGIPVDKVSVVKQSALFFFLFETKSNLFFVVDWDLDENHWMITGRS